MNDKQIIIKRIRDCDNCKFRPETSRVCSNYENCYMVSEYICKLRNQLKHKEQECEELKFKVHDLRQLRELDREARERFIQQLDQLKAAKEQSEQKLKKIKDRCKETLELMNKASGTNAYAGGRCIEAENILQIIDEVE